MRVKTIERRMPTPTRVTVEVNTGKKSFFQPAMLPVLKKIFFPVLTSTVTLVGVGILLALVFTRMGVLDAPSAYLGTSPGAMSALIVLAFESGSSATLVVCFHFFRVVFVILTAPLFLKLFS